MANTEQICNILENTAELLRKTQVNLKKCPKQRLTAGYIQSRIQCVEEYWSTFKKAHLDLVKITSREQKGILPHFLNEEFYIQEDLFLCILGDLKDMLTKFEGQQSEQCSSRDTSIQVQGQQQVRLPRIELPMFAGNYEEWPTYKDLFMSLVHENSSLTNVQRLHYLKTSTTGEAAALLKHIQITDSNYLQAWDTLKQRYGNKRLIVNSLLKRLFLQKKSLTQTAAQLKGLLDTTNEILNSLQNLKISIDSWDPMIIFLVVQKLDQESHKEWEQYAYSQHKDELPQWLDLKKFLESKFRTLELVTPPTVRSAMKDRVFHVSTKPEKTCLMCKENHSLCRCKLFSKMQPLERNQYVLNNKLCFNCLTPGHSAFKCRVPMSCRICKRRHHSLLHKPNNENALATQETMQPTTSTQVNAEEKTVLTSVMSLNSEERQVSLLATAVVIVQGNYGHTTILKALIDSGSQACFITQRATQILKLHKTPVNLIVTGMESMKIQVKHEVKVRVLSRWEPEFELPIHAYVMSKHLSSSSISSKHNIENELPHLKNLNLADPNFYESGTMDLLLGVQEYTKILQQGLFKGPSGTICAQNTSLGWIVMGGSNIKINKRENTLTIMNMDDNANINDLLKTIWEVDTNSTRYLTQEEQLCETIFEKTHTRNRNGRYKVKLPFKTEHPLSPEGNTRETAVRRLLQVERRFNKNSELKKEYTNVIDEYKQLKHMEEVPKKEINKKSVYLPHFAVVRQDKETTKTRIVFDASCKGSNGVALNDELLPGPVLQEDLRSLIMRWRVHAVCFVSDIEKMYRMIDIAKEDVDYQRIVWRNDPSDVIQDYRLLTVTFGTTSAPYLAVKTLKQLAIDESDKYPEAARILREDFYIDDCMSGSDTVAEAIRISQDLKNLLSRGGFQLKKWSSNNAEFMQSLKLNERSTKAHLNLQVDGVIKALGVQWNLGKDNFEYNLNLQPILDDSIITKRNILSDIQQLFDPLGWIAPCIVLAKILIQKLWLEKADWDEDLNIFLKEEWLKIRNDLNNVNTVTIDRWLGTSKTNMDNIQIHGFCDASTLAYAAAVYCRVKNQDGTVKTTLVAARTRVAPLKTISLPRLELCGALLLSKLLKQVSEAMRISISNIFAWTDSSIVIAWIFGEPKRWKPFVANRVVEIISTVNKDKWHHVQSHDNPADIASRGMLVSDLKKSTLWWKGPQWLLDKDLDVRKPDLILTDLEKKKQEIKTFALANLEKDQFLTQKFKEFDSLMELLRAIAYCKKFLKLKKSNEEIAITTNDIEEALNICIKKVQSEEFAEEVESLKRDNHVKNYSKLKSLDPYLDEKEILRVGGRLRQANLNNETKHPIIIGKNNSLIQLIVKEAHQKTLHGGIKLMLGYLQSRYWILRAKDVIKKYVHQCLICAKESAKSRIQIMGDLPSVRVTPARPFLNSGVDFSGPFQILLNKGRGAKTIKAYVAIFICMSTKAIHLELVGDLTSQSFIGAYKRFCARRGKCAHLYSDQGRNFIGANKELFEAWKEAKLQFDGQIADSLANDGTQWHFIPAYSPNFGGLWEAGVKSMKYHLKRILNSYLTYEEFSTVLCEIEACLNSRPLCPLSQSDENLDPLTPGHFLIGEPPITVPHPNINDVKVTHLTRWQHCQKLLNDFWCRWQNEYLTCLQQRPKWFKKKKEFNIGDIVLIKQLNMPPGKWALGRIINKHPGPDGYTRVYSVKSGESVTKRCVTKLCHLPIDTE